MDNNFIYQVGEYIALEHTVEEASLYFKKSVSSIKKYLAAIRNADSPYYNKNLASRIKLVQDKIILNGQKKGGTIGKRNSLYTRDEKIILAKAYIASGQTLAEFSELVQIPISTLHDLIRSIDDEQLQKDIDMYVARKRIQIIDKYNKEYETQIWKR